MLANPQALGHPLVCLLVLGKLPNSCIFLGNFLILRSFVDKELVFMESSQFMIFACIGIDWMFHSKGVVGPKYGINGISLKGVLVDQAWASHVRKVTMAWAMFSWVQPVT